MNPERLRHIAILVDTLPAAQADRLLDHLSEAAQRQVRDAVMGLEPVQDEERRRVVAEFLRSGALTSEPPDQDSQAGAISTGSISAPALAAQPLAGVGATYSDPRRAGRVVPPASRIAQDRSPQPAQADTGGDDLGDDLDVSAAPAVSPVPVTPGPQSPPAGANHPGPPDVVETLASVEVQALAGVVMRESPQLLAVVLSLLPPQRSAQLLDLCPVELQDSALKRLAQLEEVDDDVLHYLQQELSLLVRRRMKLKRQQRVGPEALSEILQAARRSLPSGTVVQVIQRQLGQIGNAGGNAQPPQTGPSRVRVPAASGPAAPGSGSSSPGRGGPSRSAPAAPPQPTPPQPNRSWHDPAWQAAATAANASTASPSSVSQEQRLVSPELNRVDALAEVEVRMNFEDLSHCDRSSLQAVLATAKPRLTLLALRGASPLLLQRVLSLLPKLEAREVQDRIQNLGPTRLDDIEQAQQYLLRLASVLEEMGRFRRPMGGRQTRVPGRQLLARWVGFKKAA